MKTTILSIFAAAAISLGAAGAATTASADVVATPAVASADSNATVHNAGGKLKIRIFKRYGYYNTYPTYRYYGYGSYRHCKHLLIKWKHYGSYFAKKRFYQLRCYRFFY